MSTYPPTHYRIGCQLLTAEESRLQGLLQAFYWLRVACAERPRTLHDYAKRAQSVGWWERVLEDCACGNFERGHDEA